MSVIPIGLLRSTEYHVQILARNAEGDSAWSEAASATTNPNRTPTFSDESPASRSIAENTSADQSIGSAVVANDLDSDTLTYSLSGTDSGSFPIDSSSGQITTSAALDYETDDSYSVTVEAADPYGGSSSIDVTITVTDVLEAPGQPSAPTLMSDYFELSVSWSPPANTGPTITDYDVRYKRSADSSWSTHDFTGTATSTQITGLERSTEYDVQVRAINAEGTGAWSISTTATTNANRAPSFTDGATTIRSVAENTLTGQNIGGVIGATDADNDTLTYSISGTDAASFTIDSTSGQLKTSAVLDYETDDSYSVTVEVSDGHGGTDSIAVTITILDIPVPGQPSVPTLTPGYLELTVSWSAPSNTGPVITDYDVQYRRTADSSWLDHAFTATTTSTQVTGLERAAEYEVQVRAINDEGTGYWSTSTTATTSDNRLPSFTDGATTTRSVAENTPSGQNIGGAVGATDADGDPLTYTLSGTDAASFAIDSTSGQLKTSASLDYESDDSYSVTVGVSDGHGGTDSIAVTVSVTAVNDAPTAVDDTATTTEDTAVDITVTANDTDAEGDTLSVTSVTAPSNGTAAITSGSTTTVTYTPEANFNGTDTFDYTLSDGTDTDTGTVTVSVTAVNDAPRAVDDTATTAEDTAVDITVTANDTDTEGDTLSVTSVTAPSNGTAAITSGSTTKVTYIPDANFNGTDTDTGTVTVRVGPPAKPTGLGATGGDGQATLNWDDPSDSSITGYEHLLQAQIEKLTATDGDDGDRFGRSVAVDGDTMVVGADKDGNSKGAVYVFTSQSGAWGQVAKLTASDGAGGDEFGTSVAVDGDTVVMGATGDDDNGSSSGSTYVFTKPATGWTSTSTAAKLTASDGDDGDRFGNSVAVDGATVVVGADQDDDKGSNSGSAYVYAVSDWTAISNSAAGGTNATSYTVTGLTNDTEYRFRIRATNTLGTGPASNTVTVTPAS